MTKLVPVRDDGGGLEGVRVEDPRREPHREGDEQHRPRVGEEGREGEGRYEVPAAGGGEGVVVEGHEEQLDAAVEVRARVPG